MNKKAFTLVELIGVVTLLGIITILVAPTVINQIRGSKKKIDSVTEELIYSATYLYLDNKISEYPKVNNSTYCVKLKDLVDDNKLKSPIVDANGNEISLDKYVLTKIINNGYSYELTDECSGITLNPNLTSSDSCMLSKNSICSNGTKVNVKVNKLENYDFYVIADTGSELTLIMDRNLGTKVEWINSEDYLAANTDFTVCTNQSCNDEGPLTALKALEDRTSGWTNIKAKNYTLTDDSTTPKYQPIERVNVRARMLTITEAKNLGCTTVGGSCPSFLNENLSATNTVELPKGYWTSSSRSDTDISAWGIYDENGRIGNDGVYHGGYSSVRPVIEISKTI